MITNRQTVLWGVFIIYVAQGWVNLGIGIDNEFFYLPEGGYVNMQGEQVLTGPIVKNMYRYMYKYNTT